VNGRDAEGMDRSEWPVFVLGCQRSGTSLMRRILDAHRRIACPPESAFIVQLARVYENERSMEGLRGMGFSEAEVLRRMGRFAAGFFETYAASKGKPRWADKTPHYVNHAATIDGMFEGRVLYVGMMRHGLDVAASLSGFSWGVLEPYVAECGDRRLAAVRFWRDQNRKLIRFAERVGDRFHWVRYESLTADPEPVLREVLAFLGEGWDPAVLAYNRYPHDTGLEDANARELAGIVANSYKYRAWSEKEQRRLFEEAEDVFGHFGYTLCVG